MEEEQPDIVAAARESARLVQEIGRLQAAGPGQREELLRVRAEMRSLLDRPEVRAARAAYPDALEQLARSEAAPVSVRTLLQGVLGAMEQARALDPDQRSRQVAERLAAPLLALRPVLE